MEQEVLAAWVSAGAAVTQAVGAILAIWFSVKLAKDAAAREIAAERSASHRAEEAERRAERRLSEERADRFNAPIDVLIGYAGRALDAYDATIAQVQREDSPKGTTIMSGFREPELAKLQAAIQRIKHRVEDAAVTDALEELQDAAADWSTNGSVPYSMYEKALLDRRAWLAKARDQLAARKL